MGGGKKTSQSNVPKNSRSYSTDAGVVGAGGGGVDTSSANVCLVSFKVKLDLDGSARAGMKFVLILGDDNDGLDVVSGGRKVGVYAGRRLATLKKCMTEGYRYDGTIDKVVGNSANCTVVGSGPT